MNLAHSRYAKAFRNVAGREFRTLVFQFIALGEFSRSLEAFQCRKGGLGTVIARTHEDSHTTGAELIYGTANQVVYLVQGRTVQAVHPIVKFGVLYRRKHFRIDGGHRPHDPSHIMHGENPTLPAGQLLENPFLVTAPNAVQSKAINVKGATHCSSPRVMW